MKRTHTFSGAAVGAAAWLAVAALALASTAMIASPARAAGGGSAASADAKARAEAEAKARETKRQELIALFEAGKAQYNRGELDKAQATFEKVQAEVKASGVDIDSFLVRRDPAAWLDKIKARRAELAKARVDPAAAAKAKAEADAKAKAEADRAAREKKRDELIALFNTGKDQYAKDELDGAQATFEKVKAEVEASGVDIDSFLVRRDPAAWLAKVKARRDDLAKAKADAEAEAKADAEAAAKADAEAKAQALVAEARDLAAKGDKNSLVEAKAKLATAIEGGALSARDRRRAEALLKDVNLTLGKREGAELLAKADALVKSAEAVVANPAAASAGRGAAGSRDALLAASQNAKDARAALVTLKGLVDGAAGPVLDREETKRFGALMAGVDALVARTETEAKAWDERARMEVTISQAEIERQRKRILARQAVEAGDAAARAGDWPTAKARYLEATDNDPENRAAREGLLNARRQLGEAPPVSIDDQRAMEEIRRQRFIRQTQQQLNEAQAQMRATEFKKALVILDSLVQQINVSGLPEGDVQDYRTAAERLREECRYQITKQEEQERQREIQEAIKREREAELRFQTLRDEKVKQLIAQANAYARQRDYDLAFKAATEALKLDPSNAEARIVRDQAQMWGMHARSADLRQKRDLAIATMIMDVEEARVPPTSIIAYPEDWVELSERRQKYGVMELGKPRSPAVDRIRQQLAKPVTIEFPGTSFDMVMEFLQDLTGVNIVVDENAKRTENISSDTMIRLKLNNVKLESALNLILRQVNLDYVIKDESIFITNQEGIGKDLEVRVYDVRDLVVAMGSYGGNNGGNNGGNGGGNGGGNTGTSGNWNGLPSVSNGWGFSTGNDGGGGNGGNDNGQDAAQLMGNLAALIQSVVSPASWAAVGVAGAASIQQFRNEMLIISQTPKVHDDIWNLLTQLRQFLSLQVVIEARLIKVDDNFIEDMGIDWSATLNLRDASILPDGTPRPWPDKGASRWAVQNPQATVPVPLQFQTVIDPVTGLPTQVPLPGGLQRIYSPFGVADPTIYAPYSSPFSTVPINLALPAVSAITGGVPVLTVGPVGFLDDIGVNFTLAFAQKSFRATVMTAPRVILMSGGSANISVNTSERYVASLTPVVDAGAVGYQPVMASAPSGVSLSISNCAVSHDRRYVRLSISPTLTKTTFAEDRQVFSVTIPSPGGTGGSTTTLTGSVQVPITATTTVGTDVVVPDGGTVLLGGLKESEEQEQEEGVPILSKIPVVKRLFTRRFQVRKQTNIIVLIKPTIVIPEEEEEKLGLHVE